MCIQSDEIKNKKGFAYHDLLTMLVTVKYLQEQLASSCTATEPPTMLTKFYVLMMVTILCKVETTILSTT